MTATHYSSGRRTPALALSFLAVTLACTWLGVAGNAALAQTSPAAGMQRATEAQQTPQGTAQAAKITEAEAIQIALKAVPGKAMAINRDRKFGKNLYLVEVIAQADGAETDVFVDPETGVVVEIQQFR